MSSDLEDLFGIQVAKLINKPGYKFFIDKSLSYKDSQGKSHTYKPDLLVINNLNEAIGYFDVKTDMGSQHQFFTFLESKINFIQTIRQTKETWISDAKNIKYLIDQLLKYVVVVGIDHQKKNQIKKFQNICARSNGTLEIFF